MPNIFIGGYFGAGNIGDEAILASMVGELRSRRSDLSFIVTSWDPEKTERELGVGAVFWKDIPGLIDAAAQADMILLGGGGIFHDYWGIDPDTYLRKSYWDITAFGSLPLLARLLNLPCMICAVGVGPFQTEAARQHTRLAFERCQIATLRDGVSLEFLKQTGFDIENPAGPRVEILPDPVFSLTTSDDDDERAAAFLRRRGIGDGAPLLGVSLRYWDLGKPFEEWLPIVAGGVRKFLYANEQAQAVLIPFQVLEATPHTNDATVLHRLSDLLDLPDRTQWIAEPLTPAFAQALIRRCTALAGMRLHSIIMGINTGTPVMALSYAPKVRSVMQRFGLDDLCHEIVEPDADVLADQIQAAWDQTNSFRKKVHPLQEEFRRKSLEHSRLALELLTGSCRKPPDDMQDFALQQVRLLLEVDEEVERQRKQLQDLQARYQEESRTARAQLEEQQALRASLERHLQSLQAHTAEWKARSDELSRVEASHIWKLATRYYRARDKSLLRYVHRFASVCRHEGLHRALEKAWQKLFLQRQPHQPPQPAAADDRLSRAAETPKDPRAVVTKVVDALNSRTLRGVLLVTSTFVFDELFNQRDINLCKTLARRGWGVVFVAWRWNREEFMPSIGEEVYPSIFQIPKDMLLDHPDIFAHVQCPRKFLFFEFPHPDFPACLVHMRSGGYKIVYEIIDEWEEFHKVGQASWFDKSVEEALVMNANYLTAVSSPLIGKFRPLRRDIHLLPNGFTPSLLGRMHRNIARRKAIGDEFHLGYFGYLAGAWFDWDFLLKVVDLAWENGLKLFVHLIGYGEPDLQSKIAGHAGRVTFHGKVHPSELHRYAGSWDAAFIWFKNGKLSESVDPIKIYEYLFFGLPVIVKGIPHLETHPSTQVVENERQVLDLLIQLQRNRRKRLRMDWFSNAAVSRFLAASTWEQRFRDLEKLLETEAWMSL